MGITGGIGSGKSLVCRILQEGGFPVLFADPIAIRIQETDPAVRKRVIALLGERAYRPDGSLDRAFVASTIFRNSRIRKSLQTVVHPAVEQRLEEYIASLEREKNPVIVVEAALLIESGLHVRMDVVVMVDAPEEMRIKRVVERDGVPATEVRRRMRAQWPAGRKRRLADIILGNTGNEAELWHRVQLLQSMLRTLAKRN